MSAEEALLEAANVMRHVDGIMPQDVEALRQERDEALQAAKDVMLRAEEAEMQYVDAQALVKNSKKNGALCPHYPKVVIQLFMKTKDFEKFFLRITEKPQQLGQSKSLKQYLTQYPALGDHGLPTMEELDNTIATDTAEMQAMFEDAIRDENCNFAFLEHFKKLKYLPGMEKLKGIAVDFNEKLPLAMHPLKKAAKDPVVGAETSKTMPPVHVVAPAQEKASLQGKATDDVSPSAN